MLGVFGGIILLCGGCFAVTAVGIGSSSSNSAKSSTSAPAVRSAAPSDKQVNDLAFIAVLNQHKIKYSSREAVITLAHTVCDARKSGNTEVVIALTIAEKGYTPEDAGYIVGAAESAYCPQFK